jgi:hypothetical protein
METLKDFLKRNGVSAKTNFEFVESGKKYKLKDESKENCNKLFIRTKTPCELEGVRSSLICVSYLLALELNKDASLASINPRTFMEVADATDGTKIITVSLSSFTKKDIKVDW